MKRVVGLILMMGLVGALGGCIECGQITGESGSRAAVGPESTSIFPEGHYTMVTPVNEENWCYVVTGQWLTRLSSQQGYSLVEVQGTARTEGACPTNTRAVMTDDHWEYEVSSVRRTRNNNDAEERRRAAESLFGH